jgi:hypothetical protein
VVSFPQVSPANPCKHLSSAQHILQVPPIPFFIWYLVSSTDHKPLRYVVLSTPLLPRPS